MAPIDPSDPVDPSGPVDLRVLAALTAGASTATGVAAETGETESVVEDVLEQSVAARTVVRLDLPGLPTYALTQAGHALLGGAPAALGETTEPSHALDLPPIPPEDLGTVPVPGSGGVVGDGPPRTVVRRHVVYAVGYVVLGLVLLVFAPVIGVLSILAGLVLGGFALLPYVATSRVNRR